MHKNPNMELKLCETLRLILGLYPSTNSCKYTSCLPTGLEKITLKDKADLKLI